jgi:hypothetical protein
MDNETMLKMVADPKPYGFAWAYGPVAKGQGDKAQVLMNDAPFIQHEDLALIRQTFGDEYVKSALNGQAPKVQAQRIVRDAVEDNLDIRKNMKELKLMVLRGAFGLKGSRQPVVVKVEVETFIGLDGAKYATLQEAQAASMAFMIDQQQKDE